MIERVGRERLLAAVGTDDRIAGSGHLADRGGRGAGFLVDGSQKIGGFGGEGEEEMIILATAEGPVERIVAEGGGGGAGRGRDREVGGTDAGAGAAARAHVP